MPTKQESIIELAAQTARDITRSGEAYMAFLATAANNFKYGFRDQLLIHAQKPEATACAEIDFWNRHGRWVNKGTTGIALLRETDARYKLRYVFDMSDTNSRTGRTVPVWQMRPQDEGAVIESLENRYGISQGRADLTASLLETAKTVTEDNAADYLTALCEVKTGSLLEEVDADNIEVWFKSLLENSIAYMLLTRCGVNAREQFRADDFARIGDFNTPETVSILGTATSDIAEMALREIASTVISLRRQSRSNDSVANREEKPYAESKETPERSVEDGTDLQDGGRLPAAEPDRTGGPGAGQVRDVAAQLSAGASERDLHGDAAFGQAGSAPRGDRPAGARDDGASDAANGGAAGRDGGAESGESDGMGRADEQHPGVGGGNRAGTTGLQLTDPLPTEEEQKQEITQAEDKPSSAFSVSQEDIDAVLLRGSGVSGGKFRIYEQFLKQEGTKKNAAFLKEKYGTGGAYPAIPDRKLDEWHDSKGIQISVGSAMQPDAQLTLSWGEAAKRIGELINADRYLNRAEKEHYPAYRAQEEQRKARWKIAAEIRSVINDYVDFKTQLGETGQCEKVLFAKGCADSFGMGEKKCYVRTSEGSFVLPTLRSAMQTIIGDNTHLTERCEAMLVQLSGPLAAPLEPTADETNPPPPPKKEYRFSLGDTVYLGTQEYSLIAFDEKTVRLYDPTFPLLNKEMERAEFDRMLAENPLNDPLAYIVEDVPVPAGTERSEEPAPPLAREPVSERSRDDYNSIKKQNPDSLVLYQADDFFEMYGEDAWRVGPMLGLETTVRTIPDI